MFGLRRCSQQVYLHSNPFKLWCQLIPLIERRASLNFLVRLVHKIYIRMSPVDMYQANLNGRKILCWDLPLPSDTLTRRLLYLIKPSSYPCCRFGARSGPHWLWLYNGGLEPKFIGVRDLLRAWHRLSSDTHPSPSGTLKRLVIRDPIRDSL